MKKILIFGLVAAMALPVLSYSQRMGGGGMHGGGSGMGSGNGKGRNVTPLQEIPKNGELKRDSLTGLKQFVNLSDKQLLAIRDVIDQIIEMSPKEREALRQKIAEYEKLEPADQQMIRQGWGHAPQALRDEWRDMMQQATPEYRQEIQDHLKTLDFDARNDYRMKLLEEWKAENNTND